MTDIVIKGAMVLTAGTGGRFYEKADIAISNGRIERIANELKTSSAQYVIPGKNKLALPGLINSHVHTEETIGMHMVPESISHIPWFEEWIYPYYRNLGRDDYYYSSLFSHLLMLRAGTTCYADSANRDPDAAASAADKSGIKAFVAKWTCDIGKYFSLPLDSCLRENESLLKKYANSKSNLKAIAAVIGLNQCSDDLYLEVKKLAKKYNTIITTHEASGHEDVMRSIKRTGHRPIEHLYKIGFLSPECLISHATDISEHEVHILKSKNTNVALCPTAELKKGKGLWKYGKIPSLIRKGVNLCIGTDTANSSNHLNVLKTCGLFLLIAKDYSLNPASIDAFAGFDMITQNAARALGMERTGRISEGNFADIALFDTSSLEWKFRGSPLQSVMYGTELQAITTIVNGKIVYENGVYPMIDTEKVVSETLERRTRILDKLSLGR